MITQFARSHDKVLGFQFSERLHASDYRIFTPAVGAAVAAHGPVRILIQFEDFAGWDLAAMWEDFKLTVTHYRSVERFALVGDAHGEKWVARLGELFTRAEVRYFDPQDLAKAWAWLEEGDVLAPVVDPSPIPIPDDPLPLPLVTTHSV